MGGVATGFAGRSMLAVSVPPGYRRTAPVTPPDLDGFAGIIDGWLEGRRQQRYTAKRVFQRRRHEHGLTGGDTIAKDDIRKRERRGREMFAPLAHPPGHALAGFGDATVVIDGVEQTAHVFVIGAIGSAIRPGDIGDRVFCPGGARPPVRDVIACIAHHCDDIGGRVALQAPADAPVHGPRSHGQTGEPRAGVGSGRARQGCAARDRTRLAAELQALRYAQGPAPDEAGRLRCGAMHGGTVDDEFGPAGCHSWQESRTDETRRPCHARRTR